MRYFIIPLWMVTCFLTYMLGVNNTAKTYERELGEAWVRFYDVESQGDYWELKAKKEGLI